MIEVYHEPVCRRYYAARLSCAYVFFLCVVACLAILPFFLAYESSAAFWLKTNTYREQPKVIFEHKVLGLLHGRDSNDNPLQIVYTSMAALAHLFEANLRSPVLRSIEIDKNRDAIPDRLHLSVLVPLQRGETILASSFVAFFNVKLRNRARLEMETIAYSGANSPLPGSALFVDGDYTLRQRWPLRAKGGYQLPYDNTPLLDPTSLDLAANQAVFPRLLAAYRQRNNTMNFDGRYEVWTPVLAPVDNDFGHQTFNLTVNLHVKTADVLYTPTASEVLKVAWIQYLAIFVVVAYLLDQLCAFVFYNQLVDTEMTVETLQNKRGEKVKFL
ncbi:hypothetical protein CTAYLR_003929 [Chrysophaeum taylorii]|uniref:Transmembrane protein 231 n=1 Tax=Chrysophaeum taylorii TaxID=2483200 RepID=A0AAD7XIK1_9STRA|nr:hypothetical protein CTAYLR_003929 [Chrysophaeum taylorii]